MVTSLSYLDQSLLIGLVRKRVREGGDDDVVNHQVDLLLEFGGDGKLVPHGKDVGEDHNLLNIQIS